MARLGLWDGPRPEPPAVPAGRVPALESGEATLAGWRMLLDAGRLRTVNRTWPAPRGPQAARLSAATAAGAGARDGDPVVSTGRGSITLPLVVTEMPDQVVWLPLNSTGSAVHRLKVGSVRLAERWPLERAESNWYCVACSCRRGVMKPPGDRNGRLICAMA